MSFITLEDCPYNQVEKEETLEHLNIANDGAPFNILPGHSYFQQQPDQ